MFEQTYTLFQVLGFCAATGMAGVSFGVLIGKAVQRRWDMRLFGPRI